MDASVTTTSPSSAVSQMPPSLNARVDDLAQASASTPPQSPLKHPASTFSASTSAIATAAAPSTAAAASVSSPSNHMSPAHPPTESSRHSTPATSAAGSDPVQSTLPCSAQLATSQPSIDAAPTQPPQASSPRPPSEQLPHAPPDEHPLSSIQPAYFYPSDASTSSSHDGIPVFQPTMHQFQDFYAFCQAIDSWGMQYGILKVVPPPEWRDALPDLRPSPPTASNKLEPDEHADISKVRIRNAIMQHFTPAGSGVWRQINTTRSAKIWNAKQWAELCISSDQKGPEMDRMKWKVEVEGASNGGWGPKNIGAKHCAAPTILDEDGVRTRSGKARPSATPAAAEAKTNAKRKRTDNDHGHDHGHDHDKPPSVQSHEQPTISASVSAPTSPSSPERRSQRIVQNFAVAKPLPPVTFQDASPIKKKNWEAEATTPDEWRAFDYKNCWRKEALSQQQLARLGATPCASDDDDDDAAAAAAAATTAETSQSSAAPLALPNPSEWTPEVCREIESEYWRNLNFGKPPMYGADLSGTLFDHRTKHWNVGKLDSILTRLHLRRKLPGVNTPYLYWGMWRATFAWHVEDMDLYSINYIHFGAPKQWYAIRQADRQRFESAMAGAFPADARRCPHFMRHKSYLASPSFLASHGIRPLKLVHNAGEFVITYPFGYHSGFNMGYNCAESVNFALESWLDIGRKANYCHCDMSQNSVRIDVDALLEESREMEELERKRELRRAKEEAVHATEEEELEKRRIRNERAKERRRLKKEADEAAAAANPAAPLPFQGGADFYVDPKHAAISPCVFCPANVHTDLVATPAEIDSTNPKLKAMSGRHAHRLCASFVPETWVGKHGKTDIVEGIGGIDKARFSLKCQICPHPSLQKLYPKIQCTRGKCPRSAHVSCALVEKHGWFIDVCPAQTADELEGKKASTTNSNVQQTDGLEDGDERLVVLCKAHNPLFREAEEARKAEELRERIYALPIPSMVKIKTSGGMFQALMVEIHEEEDEIVIEDEGRPSTVKFQQILLDDPVKQEPQSVGIPAADGQVALNGDDVSHPTKRRRKATEKASEAKAAKSEAVDAGGTGVSEVTAKKPRKNRGAAAAATTVPTTPASADTAATAAPPLGDKAASTLSGKKSANAADGQTKSKRQRQPKKKAEATNGDAVASMQWSDHPMHAGGQQQQQQQQQQVVQTIHVPSKRGPRATYAAQHPSVPQSSLSQYGEHHAYPPPLPQPQQQQQQQYAGGDGGPMHRTPLAGDGGTYAPAYALQQYAPGYGRSEYGAGVASAGYAHLLHQQQQQRAGNGGGHAYGSSSPYAPYQVGAHASYALAPGGSASNHSRHSGGGAQALEMKGASSTGGMHAGSQYGYLSAPVGGYERTPPLPTYAKSGAHANADLAGGGFPDYRPPYHHAAPAALQAGYASGVQYRQPPARYAGEYPACSYGHVGPADEMHQHMRAAHVASVGGSHVNAPTGTHAYSTPYQYAHRMQ